MVQEIEMIRAKPNYTLAKLPNGKESAVSLCHLGPAGKGMTIFNLTTTDLNANLAPKSEDTIPESVSSNSTERTD